ncbi:MAG: TonB-dependent receptor [Cyclobacteriaceae bacterium]|nr:TonB-dependent receptor [Cyclobacteriaceae bacterium]
MGTYGKYFAILTLCFFSELAFSQGKFKISGRLTDSDNNPVPGAVMRIINTPRSALSDADGRFVIPNNLPGTYTLDISSLGFAQKNLGIAVTTDDLFMDIQLESSSIELDEIVVASHRREDQLQSVPISITALNQSQVRDYMLWNLQDISAVVPNLFASHPGDNRVVTSLRGITTTSYEPAVVTYIDGVNQFSLDTYIAPLHDVKSIEVLRGPQGTLYGRNAMGGVINVETEKPGNIRRAFAGMDAGNYGLQRYQAGIRTPLVADKLFFGISGLYHRHDGFFTNAFDNSRYDRRFGFFGNTFLNYLINDNWSATFNIKTNDFRNFGAFPLAGNKDEALKNPFVLNQNAKTQMIDKTRNVSLSVNHFGPAVRFSSQTSYQFNHRYYDDPIDGDFSPLNLVEVINNYGDNWNQVQVWTQEFRLSSSESQSRKFNWVAGAYAFYENDPVRQGIYYGEDFALLGVPDYDFTVISSNIGKNAGVAFYGQGTFKISDRLEATLGMRQDFEHRQLTIRGEFQRGEGPLVLTRPDTAATASFNALTPKVALSWKLSQDRYLHASYTRGFRVGGLTELGVSTEDIPLVEYKPEYSHNYELGSKNIFLNKRLRLNATLFYSLLTDVQLPVLLMPDAFTIVVNGGRLESRGAELEMQAKPLKNLELNYNFGYTRAIFSSIDVQDFAPVNLAENNRQIFTPEYTSMLVLQYSPDLSIDRPLKGVLRMEWGSIGRQYFNYANTVFQDSYNLINSRVGLKYEKHEFYIWGRNLLNTTYIDYGYEFGAVRLGDPMNFGISYFTRF